MSYLIYLKPAVRPAFGFDTEIFDENLKLIPQGGPFSFIPEFFRMIQTKFFSLYIKTNSVFVLSKLSLIKIHENIIGIDT